MLRTVRLFGLSLFLPCALFSQTHWHKVKVNLQHKSIQQIQSTGLAFDHGEYKAGESFTGDFADKELDILSKHGFQWEPLSEHDIQPLSGAVNCPIYGEEIPDIGLPVNYEYGSMNGFLTFEEMENNLDLMKSLYPTIITSKAGIRNYKTKEGNFIYYIKISDHPELDENEPEVLYTALHHAREPISSSQLFYFMWYLLEQYGKDSSITALVNERELYFVPCLNPDGYEYNYNTNPRGGGYWRKNRTINAADTGVDLNRNYDFAWGFDDSGSSPLGNTDTYRGSSAFSEIETRAIREFCEDHNFSIALNYHAFGNLLIYPWGYLNRPTEDSIQFLAMANEMVRYNRFRIGTSTNLLNYAVNGVSDDYMYGEQSNKNKIFAFTPEVGTEFWPNRKDILSINKSTQYMNLASAWQAGAYASVSDFTGWPIDQQNSSIQLKVKRSGLKDELIGIYPVDNGMQVNYLTEKIEFHLGTGQDTLIHFPFELNQGFSFKDTITFRFLLKTGAFEKILTVKRIFTGNPYWFENCSDSDNWYSPDQKNWNFSINDFTSSPSSLTDSPNGPMEAFASKKMRAFNQIDLRQAEEAYLSFQAKWDLDPDVDYAQVQVSESSTLFESLCGNFTQDGKLSQDFGKPVYAGSQKEWVTEWIDLNAFLGKLLNLQVYLHASNNQLMRDGFYIDDIKVYAKLKTGNSDILHHTNIVTPNPAHDWFTIQLPNPFIQKHVHVSLIDANGRSKTLYSNTYQQEIIFSGQSLQKGLYIVRIQSDNHSPIIQKLIIE